MTRRTRGISLPQLINELKPYLIGWRGYFRFCQTPRVLTNLEAWIRRRLRLYHWRQWGNGHNRFKELRRHGVPKFGAAVAAGSPTGFWRMSGRPAVQQALRTITSSRSVSLDFMSLPELNPIEPPWYGPVCPVVWEGRRREASPYPDQSLRFSQKRKLA
ncbi:group II intron maturase-specific domain-containing protein [Mesorhizobium sp. M0139]|uniref:group II intron maturase-specific domain-containing protein n=1 Tax=Mesorhizobium sp. M0139 TaxID=2956892 RepID=UPI003337F95E